MLDLFQVIYSIHTVLYTFEIVERPFHVLVGDITVEVCYEVATYCTITLWY